MILEIPFHQEFGKFIMHLSHFESSYQSVKDFGVTILIVMSLMSAGQFVISWICFDRYMSFRKTNQKIDDVSVARIFLRMILGISFVIISMSIDLILTSLMLVTLIQAGFVLFTILGTVFIILRGIAAIANDQEDGSGFAIARSIAIFIGGTIARNAILKKYNNLYNQELIKSNDLWKQIKQQPYGSFSNN